MKPLAIFYLACLFACTCTAQQYPEFRTNNNGLMYSDAAMLKLKQMVNAQNIVYKTCDLNKAFYSLPQARVFTMDFTSPHNLKEVKAAIDKEEDFYSVMAKFRHLAPAIDTEGIVVKSSGMEDGKEKVVFITGSPLNGYSTSYIEKKPTSSVANTWHYYYEKPDQYDSLYHLTASWYPEEFHSGIIPAEYGKLIQYVDCMIDTNAQVFLTDKYSFYYDEVKSKTPNRTFAYIKNRAAETGIRLETAVYEDSPMLQFVVNNLKGDSMLVKLVKADVAEALESKISAEELEPICGALGLQQEQLSLMRSRRVMGACSQDDSPRRHAMAIATLAGETQQWDIFMRAHMDILNDRFERMSDGSYAWEQRQTYLKELEELGLHVSDMMLGMSLRATNTAANHYDGTVWRLGKAMTESADRKAFESRITALIFDKSLDDFNRGLCLLMLGSYLYRLPNMDEANGIIKTLKENNSLDNTDHIGMAIRKMELRHSQKEE